MFLKGGAVNGDRRFFLFISIATLTLSTLIFFGLNEIRNVKKQLEALLTREAEMVYLQVVREIDLILTYLEATKKGSLPLVPGLNEIIPYEDLALEETIRMVLDACEGKERDLPVKDFILLGEDGKAQRKEGNYTELERYLRPFLLGKERVFLKEDELSFKVGMKFDRRAILFSIAKEDLYRLKKYYILKDLLERESERFKVSGINIYDRNGNPYIQVAKPLPENFVFRRELDGRHMPEYLLEIVLFRDLVDEAISSVRKHLFASLTVLLILGLIAAYGIFRIENKADRRMLDLERDFAKREKLISLFMLASGMAHEIRNPLNALALSIEKLKRDIRSGLGPDEKILDLVSSEIRRISSLLEEFLLLSRGDEKKERVILRSLVEDVMRLLNDKASLKGVRLENLVNPELEVYVQANRLKQALINFILNGIEAIEDHGFVRVSAERMANGFYIFIEDNGRGIDRKDLERVLDFHYTTKDKGVGLGLPISYMIIKDHGGDLKIESERGKGTKLTVFLPGDESR